ncbi:MAG: PAS domain-containing protein [Alphaproteobacteria bacterium]|uniref:hybrid sensor histidine kinase/response regulator n=1 Tax=Marinobacter salarius TaxID=1420917 RepID=UPI0032EC95DC
MARDVLQQWLLDSAEDASSSIAMYDRFERLIYANRRFLQGWEQLDPEWSPIGRTLEAIVLRWIEVHQATLPKAERATPEQVEQRCNESLRLFRQPGTVVRTLRTMSNQIFEIRERPLSYGGRIQVIRDITPAEYNRAILLSLAEHSPEGMYVKDLKGRFLWANKVMAEGAGLTSESIVGKLTSDWLPPDQSGRLERMDNHVIETKTAITEEVRITRRSTGESVELLLTKFPVLDQIGNITAVGAMSLDITERQQLMRQLQHAQRLEVIGSLTGGIAHDFNNLLQVVSGNLELLRETVPSSEDQDLLRMTAEAADRGNRLVRQLLSYVKRSDLSPSSIDVTKVVANVQKFLKPTLGERITLRLTTELDIPHLYVDSALLESSLVNLAINARDAIEGAGTISFNVSHLDGDEMGARWIRIEVMDNGKGMDSDTLTRATEPFYSTKEKTKGSGLGLSQVQGFVHQSGGRFALESTLGEGTTAIIDLPIPESEPKPSPTNAVSRRAPDQTEPDSLLAGQVVLLVEDDEFVRDSTALSLSRLGAIVQQVRNGDEARQILLTDQDISWMLTDLVMPGLLNGFELAGWAREQNPSLIVVVASGYAFDEESADCESGVQFLRKPYSQSDLLAAFQAAADTLKRDENGRV